MSISSLTELPRNAFLLVEKVEGDTEVSALQKTIDLWNSFANLTIPHLNSNPILSERILDCLQICSVVKSHLDTDYQNTSEQKYSEEIYTCKDAHEETQSIMILHIYSSHIYIAQIVTNPQNLISGQHRIAQDSVPIRGAGKSLIEKAIQRAIELEKNTICLDALPSAVGFYEKMGFEENPFSEYLPEMILTSDKIWHLYPYLIIPRIAA